MRVLRGLFSALLTAITGCILAFCVGDYLTKLAHVPEMEDKRGMTIVFVCVPRGILAGLIRESFRPSWFDGREQLDSSSRKVARF